MLALTMCFSLKGSVPPVMAFHLGSLGFLTPFKFESYRTEVAKVFEGELSHRASSVASCWPHEASDDIAAWYSQCVCPLVGICGNAQLHGKQKHSIDILVVIPFHPMEELPRLQQIFALRRSRNSWWSACFSFIKPFPHVGYRFSACCLDCNKT